MNKYLVIKACAGIGNRIYTITRAMEIATLQNRILVVDWSDGQFAPKNVNAFNYFFEIINFPHAKEIPDVTGLTVYPPVWKIEIKSAIYDVFYVVEPVISSFKKLPLALLKVFKLQKLHGYWISKAVTEKRNLIWFLKNMFSSKSFPYGEYYFKNRDEDILVYVEFSPQFNETLFLNHISLKKEFLNKVDNFCTQHLVSEKCIGIHIRYTDKKPEKEINGLLQHLMRDEFKDNSFFLATDSIEVQKKFMDEFGNRLIVYPKFLPQTNGDGLHQYALYKNDESIMLQITEESILDMWILSRCALFYYQGNSTFSQISKTLHANKNKCIDWFSLKA